MYKKFLLYSCATILSFGVCQGASSETLKESVLQALETHPSVEAALKGRDAASATRKEAKSDLFPTLSAETSVGGLFGNNSVSRGLSVTRDSATSGLFEASASLTQPLYGGGQIKNRVEAAHARMESADYNVLDVRENLALRATQAHIGVLQAQATLNKTKSYLASIENYLQRIELMVNEGAADESEAAQARNIGLMLQSSLVNYEGQLETARANYKEIIGHLPKTTLVEPSDVSNLVGTPSAAFSYAKENHPLLKSNEKEMEAITYDVKVEKADILPSIDAEISGIKREQREVIGGKLEDARALLRMNWGFETGGASKARVNRSKAQYAEIVAENKERLRTIEGDIQRAYSELETAQKQVVLVEKRETVTRELSDAYKIQFEGARVRLLQLMQAENQLFNAQLESIGANYRTLFAKYNILASMGQLQNRVIGNVQLNTSSVHSVAAIPQPVVRAKPVEKVKLSNPSFSPDPVPVRKSLEPRVSVLRPVIEEEISEKIPEKIIRPAIPAAQEPRRYIPRSRSSASSERIYITTQ